jgi:hypothetical protein
MAKLFMTWDVRLCESGGYGADARYETSRAGKLFCQVERLVELVTIPQPFHC